MLFNEIGRYLVYVNFFKSCIQNRKELNILVSIVFSPSLKGILANKTTSIMSFLTNKQWIVSQQLCIYLMLTSTALLRISPAKSSLKLQTVKFLNYFPIEK